MDEMVPPILQRSERYERRVESILILWGPAAFGMILAVQVLIYGEPRLFHRTGFSCLWSMGLPTLFYFLALLWLKFRPEARALKSAIRANSYLICGFCGYSLIGNPARGVCPECGNEYALDDLRSFWAGWTRRNGLCGPFLEAWGKRGVWFASGLFAILCSVAVWSILLFPAARLDLLALAIWIISAAYLALKKIAEKWAAKPSLRWASK